MSKRKLTLQQQQRIQKNQQRKRQQAKQPSHPTGDDQTAGQHGLVTAHYGQQLMVQDDAGNQYSCRFRTNLGALVVGDEVVFQPPTASADGIITAITPRRNLLSRPDNFGNLKPVAANIDQLFIVFASAPTPSSQLLDRYLVAAETANIPASLLLNKTDIADATTDALIDIYQHLPYPLFTACSLTGNGLNELQQAITQRTVAFVGQSGVGKSSLINALFPAASLATNTLSDTSGLGQHTTVTSRLLPLPDGGHLIDSPGVREFGLWHISPEQLLTGYVELAALAGHCKFRNCQHQNEPGCALRQGVINGQIHPQRLENYFAIAATLDEDSRARY